MPASATERVELDATAEVAPMSRPGRAVKRALDIFLSAFLLVLLLPLIAFLAFLVKWQDGGPMFYRRRVIGQDGNFDAFKLRSMRVDADQVLQRNPSMRQEFEVHFKLKEDPRATPLGAVLRKASLDELPQLWNVLKGDMSLVGPRMISPPELEKYGSAGWIFHRVKPGLTGYWQTQGRQEVSYEQRVALDLFYVKNWSLMFDLKIILKTPLRIVRGKGAY
jgi:lipopolysaccharide/colanic/teichoic acid biosynthesis glycosyltransferase